ncbi:hypothetical protein PVK06_049607 [Gossypium arboreum]|uniref:Uncharacterized protein n=1 Tax=Gossypium arboreum TaxID=29729 RepID=A0ABR0MJ43_GOSAR|nr:hypothetical protein PVK06_049607 [Gossypium arboreum]
MVSFNHGLTHYVSGCHGIFQPWSYTFRIRLPWYLSTMVLHITYQVAMVSFNHSLTHFLSGCHGIFQPWYLSYQECAPANLILTAGLPVQAKSLVGEERILVRVKEIGLSRSFNDINRNCRVKERDRVESIQENDDDIVSESGSTIRIKREKAINVIFFGKEKVNGDCQKTWENESNWGEEQLCGFRAEINLEKEEDSNCNEQAEEDINNMGLAIVELNMKDNVGGREKQGGNRVCISLEERLDMQRARTLRHDGSPKSNIMDDHLKIVESGGEGREVRAKIEMDSSNKKGKKKKRQGRKVRSMLEIQYHFFKVIEKKKRGRALGEKKGKEYRIEKRQ